MTTRNVLISAVLKDSSGAGVSGKSIAFSYTVTGSGATPTPVGTGTTDTTGTASATISITAPTTIDSFGDFTGDSSYEASNGSDLAVLIKLKSNLVVTAVAE